MSEIEKLTPKEKEIFKIMVTEPEETTELARKHLWKMTTLKTHVTHIYEKLYVSSRTELIIKYYQNKLREFKNIIESHPTVSCSGVYDCSNCEDEISEQGKTCMERGINVIKEKIEEVLNEFE